MVHKQPKKTIPLVALLGSLLLALQCSAAVQYWDGPHTTQTGMVEGGSGTWDNMLTNWTNVSGTSNTSWGGDQGVFSATTGTVTLGDNIAFNGIQFSTDGYEIHPDISDTFSLTPNAFATFQVDTGVTATISAKISGSSIIKNGDGVLVLSATGNTLTGTTEIDGGVFAVSGTISNLGDTYVGNNNGSTHMRLTGQISDQSGLLGVNPSSSNNTAVVTGVSASWTNTTDLNVGFQGESNTLTIEGGASVLSNATKIGGAVGADGNQVIVTGTGTTLSNTTFLAVGYSGQENSLTLSGGGIATNTQTLIGFNSTSNANSVLVFDAGTVWTDHGTFYLGYDGSHNSVSIFGGGVLNITSQDAAVGFNVDSLSNSLTVTGTGSKLELMGAKTLYIGDSGSNNSMLISDGGLVAVNKNGRIGSASTSNNNTVTVTGAGSAWTTTGTLRVGSGGSGNSLIVESGAAVNIGTKIFVGNGVGSANNSITVDGSGSTLVTDELYVGLSGTNSSLTVSNGGNVTAASIFDIASNIASSGVLNIGAGGAPGTINTSTILGGLGSSNVIFNHNDTAYNFSPKLSGFLALEQAGSGTTILNGANNYFGLTTVDQGVLVAGGVDVFSPNSSIVVNSAGTLNAGGYSQSILDLSNSGLVEFGGASPTVIFSVQNYTQHSDGTLLPKINFQGQSDLLTASLAASLAGTLSIQATDDYAVFHQYHILHASGGVTGVFDTVNANNPLVTTTVDYEPDDVYLSFQPNLVVAGITQNEINVATQIDSITDPTSDELTVLNALVNLSVEGARRALNVLSGEQYTYLIQLDRYNSERFNGRIFNALRQTLDPCWWPSQCEGIESWLQIEEEHCFAHGDHNSKGLRASGWDFSVGAFKSICNEFLVGAAANYQIGRVWFNQGGHTNRQSFQGSLYGTYKNPYGYAFADLILGGSWGHLSRQICFGPIHRTAKSSPNTEQCLVYTELGLNCELCHVLIQPFVAGEFGFYQQNKISEHGSDSLNLDIKRKVLNINELYLGAHFTTDWHCMTCNLDASWQHQFNHSSIHITNAFQDFGKSFDIEGARLGTNAIRGAFNISTAIDQWATIYVELSGERWKNWSAYGIDLGVNILW